MSGWVLITREAQDLAKLQPCLPDALELVAFPVLRLTFWEDQQAWEKLTQHSSELALLAFTSRHAPRPFMVQAQRRGLATAFAQLPAAAVGEGTAVACRQEGLQVALVGAQGGEFLAEAVHRRFSPPAGVVFPCGRDHREELVCYLSAHGFSVFPVPVYAMEPTPASELPPLPSEPPQAVVLTSPRAATHYWQATQGRFATVPHLAWGPTTAQEVKKLGVPCAVLPQPNRKGLKEALCRIL